MTKQNKVSTGGNIVALEEIYLLLSSADRLHSECSKYEQLEAVRSMKQFTQNVCAHASRKNISVCVFSYLHWSSKLMAHNLTI